MADAELNISQRHYDIILTTPVPDADSFPEVTASVVQVAELLDEYVMLEDATADFDIEFTVAPLDDLLSVSRNKYTIEVTVGRNITAKQILNRIAADLVEIYDEQDSDYSDDMIDLQIALDLDSSQSDTLSPPRKKSKRKRRTKKKSKDTAQTELMFTTEET